MRAVNLLPPDTRGASKATAELGAGPEAKGGAGPFVVLGVLAACVAGAAGYVVTGNTVKQREADLAQVTARQQALANQAAQLKPYADFDASARARVQTVKDLATSRFDWEQALRDLSRAIPQDVTLRTLTGEISAGAGSASSPLRGAIGAPAITLQGCAPGQTQVARLASRLGAIDGVTRVSLSKSTNETIDVNSIADGTETERRNAAPCGTGKRPAFELVLFFEKATDAVAATPTTSTGQLSATPTPTPTATATATPAGTSAENPASEEGATK